MAFDEVARASIVLEAEINENQVRQTAQRAATIAQQQIARSTERINRQLTGISTRNVTRTSDAFTDLASRITQTAERAIPRLITRLGQLTVVAGAAFTFFGVRAAQNIETLQTSLRGLENVLGTTAEEAFRRLQAFAAVTPFQVQDLTAAVIRLSSALRTDLAESLDVLTILGNAGAAVGATSEQINQASLALAQIAARGKLSAQELNQLANALPNISRIAVFDELASRLRITRQEVQQLAEQGLIPAGVALESILQVAKEVPGAFGAMDRQARTFTGVMSTLRDNINLFLGQAFLPLIQAFARFAPGLLGSQEQITKLANAVGEKLLKAFEKVLPSIEKILPALTRLFAAILDSLPAISDLIVAATPLIIGFIDGFAGLIRVLTAVEPLLRDIIDAMSFLIRPLEGIRDGLESINKVPLLGRLVPDSFVNNTEKAAKATEGVKTALEGAVPDLSRFGSASDLVSDSLKNVTSAFDKIDTATKATTTSTRALTQATQALTALERERTRLLADTSRDLREVAEAEEKLTRIRFTLRDLDQEEAEILEKLNELRSPASAEELADADRDIERAKIALNKALREEAALNTKLTKTQKASVDLTGLTLDQIRSKLANIRSTNAAQRATERTGKTQAEIEEQQLEARLNIADAQQALNEATATRLTLEQRVQSNAVAIREAEERLLELSIDRSAALREEGVQQGLLNSLRSGDTTRAKELKELEEKIAEAKERQRDAQQTLAETRQAEAEARAEALGDEKDINGLLLDRIALNKTLLAQSPELFAQTLQSLLAVALPALPRSGGPGAPGAINLANELAAALLNNPNALKDILRRLGVPGLAEGGLITSPVLARLGEGSRHELVLPLTKPSRVWELLSASLPRFPAALSAAQAAIAPPTVSPIPFRLGSGGQTSTAHKEREAMAEAIADALVRKGLTGSQVTIEAPVQIASPVQDPNELARKVAQRIERSLARGLS